MKKTLFIKLLCLAVLCALLIPMVIACGEDETPPAASSTPASVEMVTVVFNANGGSLNGASRSVQVQLNKPIPFDAIPDPTKEGSTFVGWAYDNIGNDMWSEFDTISMNTKLTAIWKENGSNPGGGTTGSSNNGGGDVVDPPASSNTVNVTFNCGATGYFDDNKYIYTVPLNGYFTGSLPTPLSEDASMRFDGWFSDPLFQNAVGRSYQYKVDTTLYAKWTQLFTCKDGSYDHDWDLWYDKKAADCTSYGIKARPCKICGNEEEAPSSAPLGHQFAQYQEAFMSKQRTCQRLGCGEVEIINYKDVTLEVLGNNPAAQIDGNTEAFFAVPFTALINGIWDEGHGKFVGPKGVPVAYITFTFVEATALDRIYFKGDGTVSMNIYVQYEGEDNFTNIGLCGGAKDKESTPFKEADPTKKIVAVKFQEENPRHGESMWQEVAFVKVAAEE